jgi:hypothetical protein
MGQLLSAPDRTRRRWPSALGPGRLPSRQQGTQDKSGGKIGLTSWGRRISRENSTGQFTKRGTNHGHFRTV